MDGIERLEVVLGDSWRCGRLKKVGKLGKLIVAAE
jgi:hypothetical protein